MDAIINSMSFLMRQKARPTIWLALWAMLGQAILMCCPNIAAAMPVGLQGVPTASDSAAVGQHAGCHTNQTESVNSPDQLLDEHCGSLEGSCCVDSIDAAVFESIKPFSQNNSDLQPDFKTPFSVPDTTIASTGMDLLNYQLTFTRIPQYIAYCSFLE